LPLDRTGLDCLGALPFPLENPRFEVFDFLGFPWILSSESSLINWLHAIFAERNFSRPFAIGGSAGAAPTVSGMRKRRIAHTGKLNLISDFMQYVVVRSACPPGSVGQPSAVAGRPLIVLEGRGSARAKAARARSGSAARHFAGLEIQCLCVFFKGKLPAWATSGVCGIHALMLRAEKTLRDELARSSLGSLSAGFRNTRLPPQFSSVVQEWFSARQAGREDARLSAMRSGRRKKD
jgi:hypothetical protein